MQFKEAQPLQKFFGNYQVQRIFGVFIGKDIKVAFKKLYFSFKILLAVTMVTYSKWRKLKTLLIWKVNFVGLVNNFSMKLSRIIHYH